MSRDIDYGNLMHDAMRSLIRKVLLDVADNGLPGSHHFLSPLILAILMPNWLIGCSIVIRAK